MGKAGHAEHLFKLSHGGALKNVTARTFNSPYLAARAYLFLHLHLYNLHSKASVHSYKFLSFFLGFARNGL